MVFGISTASFYPQLTEVTLQQFAHRQMKCCEVFFNTLSEIRPEYVEELARIASAAGIFIPSAHPFTCAFEPFMLFTGYERRFQDALEWHRHYFDAMNRLGAGIFVFHGDRNGSALPDEEYFCRFARLQELGREYGIVVAQENVSRCRSGSLDFLCRMRDYLGSRAAFVFDNKQAVRSGVETADYFRELGKNVVHVHISDHAGDQDCMPLREDSPVIADLLLQLKQFDYSGAVVIELYGEQLAEMECVYTSLQRLIETASRLQL